MPSEYTQTSKVVIWLTYSREAYPDCTQLLAYPKGWRTTSAFRPTLEPNAARCCPASNSSQPFARNQVVPSEYTQSSKVVIGVLIVVKRTPVGPTCLIAILIRSPVLKTRRRNHRKNPSLPTSETVDARILAPPRKSKLVTRGKKLLLFQKVRPPRPPSLNVEFARVSFWGGARIRALAARPLTSIEKNWRGGQAHLRRISDHFCKAAPPRWCSN